MHWLIKHTSGSPAYIIFPILFLLLNDDDEYPIVLNSKLHK